MNCGIACDCEVGVGFEGRLGCVWVVSIVGGFECVWVECSGVGCE